MDAHAVAEELKRRQIAASRRARRARQRIEEIQVRLAKMAEHELNAGLHLERAQSRASAAHRDAQLTHIRSADLHEERARDLRRAGASDAASHAEERADSERENAEIEAERLGDANDRR